MSAPASGPNEGDLNTIRNSIVSIQSKIDQQNTVIQKKAKLIDDKQKQVFGQSQELDDKLKLLETRNKMLQLSIERNAYKKKVIYTILSIILVITVAMLCIYGFMNKKNSLVL